MGAAADAVAAAGAPLLGGKKAKKSPRVSPHLRVLIAEVLGHQAKALPALLITLLAFYLQSFVVPLRSAKLCVASSDMMIIPG